MKKNTKIDSKTSGIITSIVTTLPFAKININNSDVSISGISQIIIINSIIFILIALQDKGKEKKLNYIFFILTTFYAATCTVTSLFSNEILLSISRIVATFSTPFLILALTSRTPDINKFSDGFFLGIFIICTISITYSMYGAVGEKIIITKDPNYTLTIKIFGQEIAQKISHRAFYYDGQKYLILRFSGILPNANGLGLLCSIAFFTHYAYANKPILKTTIQSISIIGILLSLSRMGIFLFIVGLAYTRIAKEKSRQTLAITVTILTFIFVILVSSKNILVARISSLFGEFSHHEIFRLGERGHLMVTAWNGFLDNWLLGAGFGLGSEYLFPASPDTQAVHSAVLNSLVETGIIGTLPLLALWLYPILANTRDTLGTVHYPTQSHVIAGILLGLFVAETFDLSITRFHYIHLIFFTLLGIWFSLQQKSEQIVEQDAQSSRPPKMP